MGKCREPLGLSVAEGAKVLGVTRQAMNNLVRGGKKRGRESFLDMIVATSVKDRPCHAARALLLETSPITS